MGSFLEEEQFLVLQGGEQLEEETMEWRGEQDEGEEDQEATMEEEDLSESDSDTVQGSTSASETEVWEQTLIPSINSIVFYLSKSRVRPKPIPGALTAHSLRK